MAEPLQSLPTVLGANSGLGEMAESLQSLPTVLGANSGLGEMAEPLQKIISPLEGGNRNTWRLA